MLMQMLLIMTIYSYAMQSTFSAKQKSRTMLAKIDPCLIKDIIWCIKIRFSVFVALFSIWIWWSQKLGFIIKHAFKHGRCSLFMLELYCNHSFFYSAKLRADKVGWPCTIEDVGFIYIKHLCCDHVLPTDFTAPEGSGSSMVVEVFIFSFITSLYISIYNKWCLNRKINLHVHTISHHDISYKRQCCQYGWWKLEWSPY